MYAQGELVAGDSMQIHQSVLVPPLPASELTHCDIINISYFVVVSFYVHFCIFVTKGRHSTLIINIISGACMH